MYIVFNKPLNKAATFFPPQKKTSSTKTVQQYDSTLVRSCPSSNPD